MIPLHKKWRAGLAALLLAALPVAVVSASPAAAPLDLAGSVAGWLEGWADGWVAWLLPGRATAGAEAVPAEPPTDVAPGDDSLLTDDCDPIICKEGKLMPDFDPDG